MGKFHLQCSLLARKNLHYFLFCFIFFVPVFGSSVWWRCIPGSAARAAVVGGLFSRGGITSGPPARGGITPVLLPGAGADLVPGRRGAGAAVVTGRRVVRVVGVVTVVAVALVS